MYPNLYYVFKDWFGVSWKPLGIINTFGFMVAMAFITAAIILSAELKRKEKLALLLPREETIMVGKPASWMDLLINFFTGFFFGYKFIGVLWNKPEEINTQEYIFSSQGNWAAGILLGLFLAGIKWWEKNKQKTSHPEQRILRIWPHDRVGDIIVLGLVFGIIGAKLFDSFENWDDFIKHPIERIFSAGGLTFYGGLIMAAVAICYYGYRKNIKLTHLVDAAAPALMLAYAVGRIGCQVSGDGDWGIFNSAYITDSGGHVIEAKPGEFDAQLKKYNTYFLEGTVRDTALSRIIAVTDRTYQTLADVPHMAIKAPSFLPVWMIANSYAQNVNKDGIPIQGISEEHNKVLPVPVFPTPFYETIICTVLFLFLWMIRRKITTPGIMFGIYLMLNGAERFMIEHIRVNNTTSLLGMKLTQAEIISFTLLIAGMVICITSWAKGRRR